MRLTVVGCSGSYPGPESAASCYLLEAEHEGRTWRVLLDLGSGSLGTLHRFVDPTTVDAVLVSHLHPDHYFDISGLYVLWKYHPRGPLPRIPVWGPKGMAKQCARAYGLSRDPGMGHEFDFHQYDGQPVRLGPFTVHLERMAHPVRAFGMRVEADGRVLVYSGDTGPCRALVELARGADLLLAESAFVEGGRNPVDLHMTGRQAGATAREAGAARLVLTHIPPWHDPEVCLAEAREAYSGPLEAAVTGARYVL
ncbi:MAG TPA: MBL fold metallo-hydrolase [Nocardioidaceae bacterium]|nr:MBL fold metallo-hydrolase [Nocardioidaceae bacterium]